MKVPQMLFALLFPDYLVLITVVSLLAAILSYGSVFANLQKQFYESAKVDYEADMLVAIILSVPVLICPPVILLPVYLIDFMKDGLKFK